MFPVQRVSRIPAPLLASLSLIGCGSGTVESQKLLQPVPVKGSVLFKGKPLAGGSIRFEPVDGGREAAGAIGPDGSFSLSTFQNHDGAVVGLHRVGIEADGGKKIKLPMKFRSPASSGIELEVTPNKTEYVVDLK